MADSVERSVHLESDWFFRWIRSGFIPPHLPASHSQNTAVMGLEAMSGRSDEFGEDDGRSLTVRRWVMGIGPDLDDAMAQAWPPAITERIAGWTLRYTAGVTRRANSVLAVGVPADVDAAIVAVEQFYERHAAPPVFLVSDASTPRDVGAALVERGYVEDAPTWIVHRDVVADSSPAAQKIGWRVDSADVVTDAWFDPYWAVEGGRRGSASVRVLRDVLLKPPMPTRFVTVGDERSVFAVGQLVVVGEWACLQCLATVPAHRRQGAGGAVVDALTREAASMGAKVMFGAVMADNEASLGLFGRLGYERSHRYQYFVR